MKKLGIKETYEIRLVSLCSDNLFIRESPKMVENGRFFQLLIINAVFIVDTYSSGYFKLLAPLISG